MVAQRLSARKVEKQLKSRRDGRVLTPTRKRRGRSGEIESASAGDVAFRTQAGAGINGAAPEQNTKKDGGHATTIFRICRKCAPSLQNMKPASRTPRGWLVFRPAGPNTSPGVELVA